MSKLSQKKKEEKKKENPTPQENILAMKQSDIVTAVQNILPYDTITIRFRHPTNRECARHIFKLLELKQIRFSDSEQVRVNSISDNRTWDNADNRVITFTALPGFNRESFEHRVQPNIDYILRVPKAR